MIERAQISHGPHICKCLAAGLWFAVAVWSLAEDRPSEADQIALGLKTLPRDVVQQAYQKIWNRYVLMAPGDQLERASSVGAIRIEGEVLGLASGRRAILQAGKRRYAVAMRFGAKSVVGQKIQIMAVRSSVPSFSYEAQTNTRESLPQYNDVTMSFDKFVEKVRRGHHFPEAPELGTKPNRVGLFQIGRGERNKVDALVRERSLEQTTKPRE